MSSLEDLVRVYDQRAQIPFDGSTYLDRVSGDIEALGLQQQDDRILDIGCGRGWHLRELVQRGQRNVWGIDASGGSLGQAALLLKGELGRSVHLVHGDVVRWGVTNFFDVASCFLACLGAVSSSADRAFALSARRMLRSRGRFVATVFDKDGVDDLVGRFHVSYAAGADEKLTSEVSYDADERRLLIAQSHSGLSAPLVESLYLYSRDDVERLLNGAGFQRIEIGALGQNGSNGLMLVMAFVGD